MSAVLWTDKKFTIPKSSISMETYQAQKMSDYRPAQVYKFPYTLNQADNTATTTE